jgi:hypothetical protein
MDRINFKTLKIKTMPTPKSMEEQISDVTEEFQKDCHQMIEDIFEIKKTYTHQDCTNVWMYKKFAEFEVRLRQLEFLKTIKLQ